VFGDSRDFRVKMYFGEQIAAQPRVKLTRLRLKGCGAIFGILVSDKIGLRSQSRRAAYTNVKRPVPIKYIGEYLLQC